MLLGIWYGNERMELVGLYETILKKSRHKSWQYVFHELVDFFFGEKSLPKGSHDQKH